MKCSSDDFIYHEEQFVTRTKYISVLALGHVVSSAWFVRSTNVKWFQREWRTFMLSWSTVCVARVVRLMGFGVKSVVARFAEYSCSDRLVIIYWSSINRKLMRAHYFDWCSYCCWCKETCIRRLRQSVTAWRMRQTWCLTGVQIDKIGVSRAPHNAMLYYLFPKHQSTWRFFGK